MKWQKRLPPYLCDRNPIELICADAKNVIAANSNNFKFEEKIL